MNVNDVKIRCHALGKIMTDSRDAITEKQLATIDELIVKQRTKPLTANQAEELERLIKKRDNPKLSTTCTDYLVELYLFLRYGRRKLIESKYLEKGLHVEEDSATVYSLVKSRPFFKNSERFEDQDFIGLPDNVEPDRVRDFKSSWDLITFTSAVVEPINALYEWQLRGYMQITGRKVADLCYVLVDTPAPLVQDEKKRLAWKMGLIDSDADPDYVKACAEIDRNSTFADIPLAERVHEKTITHDPAKIIQARERVRLCREYMAKTWPDFFDPAKDNRHPLSYPQPLKP